MFVVWQGVITVASVLTSVLPTVVQPESIIETILPNRGSQQTITSSEIVGAKCPKVGALRTTKSFNFRCVKSAKGLRWVETSKTISPTNTASTATSTTTTIPVPTDDIATTVRELLVAAAVKDVASTTKIQYLSEEPVNSSGEEAAKRGVNPALKLFAQLGFDIPTTVIVLFAKSEAGVRSQLFAEGCNNRELSTGHLFLSATGGALSGSCSNNRVAVVAGPVSLWGSNQSTISFQHTLPHEIFHQWQMNTTSSYYADFPKWLYEGTPQFMTRVAFWSWNLRKDPASWLEDWYTTYSPSEKTMCQGITIEEMVDPNAPWGRPGGCAYSKGQLAIEVLIARYGGFEALKNLYTSKTTPGLSGFANHFQRVTGRALTEFYSEVNAYFPKRNFP
jgi:hypothetical protein